MTRLMVVCLGGLAGAGAVVCCDLDEGLEELQAQPDGEEADVASEGAEPAKVEGDTAPVH